MRWARLATEDGTWPTDKIRLSATPGAKLFVESGGTRHGSYSSAAATSTSHENSPGSWNLGACVCFFHRPVTNKSRRAVRTITEPWYRANIESHKAGRYHIRSRQTPVPAASSPYAVPLAFDRRADRLRNPTAPFGHRGQPPNCQRARRRPKVVVTAIHVDGAACVAERLPCHAPINHKLPSVRETAETWLEHSKRLYPL